MKSTEKMRPTVLPRSLNAKHTALIIIDVQNEYFEKGRVTLPNAESAALMAKELLAWARDNQLTIIHMQHLSASPEGPVFLPDTWNVEINSSVQPLEGEIVIQKLYPSSFQGTALQEMLDDRDIETLIVCGFMTHMCVESTVRDAFHRGYEIIVDNDACATRDLPAAGVGAPISHDVIHQSSLASLNDLFAHAVEHKEVLSLSID
ncbi:MAG: cysteine hydrolase [Thiotrichales bacterium]|nr:cysteine hydrolase [Thiotrichales bacterium]